MEEDPPPVRCPCCGSAYTSPLPGSDMWECHYSLCRAIFPIYPARGGCQMAIVAEEMPPYLQTAACTQDSSMALIEKEQAVNRVRKE